MAVETSDKGDFKDKQFAETEVADKVVEQCKSRSSCIPSRVFV
jgi:hypothetical protein